MLKVGRGNHRGQRGATWPWVLSALAGIAFVATVVFFLLEGRRIAAESAAAQFQERLAQEFIRMDTLARSYQALFAASIEVTADEFGAFSALVLPHASMLAQAVYAPRITQAERPAFENWLREQDQGPPVITEMQPDGRRIPAPPSPAYYPIVYLARASLLDGRSLGLDTVGTNHEAYAAMQRNQIYASDPVQLPSGVTIYTISVPVRERTVPADQHTGLLLLTVKPMQFLDKVALPDGLSARLSVTELQPHHPDPTLWARASETRPPLPWLRDLLHWESVRTLKSNGRHYRLELQRDQALQPLDWGVLLGSVLLSIGGIVGAVLLDRQRMQVVRAESTSKAKSEFLAIMSHEIRTPLNGIMGMAELLSRAELSAQERRYAEIIVNSGKSLLQIINDILDFSKIEAGRLELEAIDVNLEALVGELSELYSHSSYLKGISFAASMDPACPRVIRGDPTRLRQVLLNLLSNAFKFTERGEVVLRVSQVGEQNGLPLIQFTVRDTGIGISDQMQRQLFAPFSQADSSTSRRYGGTGLGLTICQLLVGLMGGRISVHSTPGEGSEFTFSAAFAPGKPLPQGNGPELKNLAGQHVLIVDDFETARMIFAEQARCLGMRVEVASHCEEAWRLLNREGDPFDLIITDLDMPTIDGIEFIRQLTHNPGTRDIPVYLMSASSSLNRRDLEGLGIAYAGTKPSTYQQLGAILSGHQEPAPIHHHDTLPPPMHVLVAEDNATNAMVISGMLRQLQQHPEVCDDGAKTLARYIEQPAHFGLVLMDCEMPEMDGFETTRRIRDWEQQHNQPPVRILALTAHVLDGFEQRCRDAGMDGYLSKPISLRRLSQALHQHAQAF